MKINNLSVDVKSFVFAIKKLYFKLIFESISGNCDPLFSHINFDHTHFGGFCPGGLPGGFMSGQLCLGGYVLESQIIYQWKALY